MIADATPYPAVALAERHFAQRVWTHPPNPLRVWVASLSGDRFKLETTGATEADALARMDQVLTEVVALPAGREPSP